ncbi:IS110 family transposase [Thermophagus xiamenensis]|uniref:Transposase n=1 Tax=Thermophagus xiamenensis TaxID=385682 RepID=A0A1I2G3H1_9BACT|nr:IS110 family transposase [Thermophagus xiamenensis]SFF11689.1 Transposase [Thermophagus xiamenensis]
MINQQILKQNIGIDISKDAFDAYLVALTKELDIVSIGGRRFKNTDKGIEEFVKWAEKKANPAVELEFTMESTGVYYENLAYTLFEEGYIVHVVLPNLAKKYIESLGLRSKTDKLDAKALGQMGVERKLSVWHPASKNIRILKVLTRERTKRQKEKTVVKNQLHALKHSKDRPASSIQRLTELINFLEQLITDIDKEIKQLITEDEVLNLKVQNIISTPGLGITTAASVIAETNGFAGFNNIKQLQSFAGYDIKIRESGKWKGKSKISKKGNSYIRYALYFPAYTIIRKSPHYKTFYDRLLDKKGESLIAATAVQRKLLGLIYTLWKKDVCFDPDIESKQAA